MKKINIIKLPNGELAQLLEDGTTELLDDDTDWDYVNNLSDACINESALSDFYVQPLSDEELRQFRQVVDVKEIRSKLCLSQKEFADSFLIPKRTLQDWEQNRRKMDSTAIAYLSVISKNPNVVINALHSEDGSDV